MKMESISKRKFAMKPKAAGTAAKGGGGGKRKPLADRTNTIASLTPSQSSSSFVIKPSKPPSSTSIPPKSQLRDLNADATSDVSISGTPAGSSNRNEKGSPNPSSKVSPLPDWTSVSGAGSREEYSGTVYTRRKRKDKSIAHVQPEAQPFNFPEPQPQVTKIPNPRDKISKDGHTNKSGALASPQKKKQCRQTQSLPQDFMKTQKEYFDEIDKFELVVEEVASDDELE